ncbi:MAG TPA: YggS family pyridoxal phosphate-dependent enzyme [Candidatus Sumerlaeota bacterium]|nr:YggS family pyridoxal phosphate-dependent enzyme [Candidatus Sumerlaeota bacterium]HPS00497.1 YggS family pyridoxal phosphate-dependent enzyme [Candidatus Sumerlaeota bacterium]
MRPPIAQNLQDVLDRMTRAARRVGRAPEEVRLVAVTKLHPPEEIHPLIAAGQTMLGENRVQDLVEKMDLFDREPTPLEWHLIGHLQTNKARKVVGRVALIHGVDSLHLAEALQQAAESADTTVEILLQVNISGEESKFGLEPTELDAVARGLAPLDRVRCCGLMTMAPFEMEPEETRPVFRGLRETMEQLRERGYGHLDLRHLSMGMTNDFEVAIEEGATLVRVGTALFAGGA